MEQIFCYIIARLFLILLYMVTLGIILAVGYELSNKIWRKKNGKH